MQRYRRYRGISGLIGTTVNRSLVTLSGGKSGRNPAISCIAPRPCEGRYGVRHEDIRPTPRGELPADLQGASVLASLTDLGARRRQHCRPLWVGECP
jgi:hypothetical protein